MADIKQIKVGGTTYNIEPYTSYVTLSTQQDNISGRKTFTGSVKISGRYQNSGDDEGLIIGRASNSHAGLCLGDPSGVRSVLYLKPDDTSVWRWSPAGSDLYDIAHPGKTGTIALTSDIPSTSDFVTLTGSQTITGQKTFSKPIVITHNTSATYYQRLIYDNHRNSGMKYDYGGNEALIISAGTYDQSSMHFYTSGRLTMDDSSSNQWSGTTPCMAIKNKCVAINGLFSGTPTHNLHVTGTAYFTSSITASSVYATSDERLKENITTAELNYYDFVNNIHLVNYTWKDDENHSLQHGVIAQELQNIIPDELKDHFILTDKGCDGMLAVNDGKLVYIALGALQQQAKINAQLEERISKLEKLLGV